MKKLGLLFACFTIALLLQGQDNNFNRSPVNIPSPDAAQFIRYGDIPMDYSTGVPNISIPLYTVNCGKLSLPIDISYNASGIKVADIAGTVGLGWSLNAGGLVSRTIMGTDDQQGKPKPFLSAADFAAAVTSCYTDVNNVNLLAETVDQIFKQFNETQSDRYFYTFNGRSGVFRQDFQSGIVKTIPYSALKVSMSPGNSGPYKITTEDGTNYYFGQPELASNYYMSYYLTKIESADLTHVINIYYRQDDVCAQFIKNYTISHTIDVSIVSGPPPVNTTKLQDNEFVNQSLPEMPDSITSDNEVLQFQYIMDRPDPRKSRLTSIKILNRVTREVIKIIEFQQSYFGTATDGNQRLRLDHLNIKDGANATVQPYSFGYNSMALPPYYHQLGMTEHHNVDYWGYYNGTDAPNLIPNELFDYPGTYFTLQERQIYGGFRNPNPQFTQACILNQITYPTGGRTDFVFENNQVANGYSYTTGIPDFGGLRVKTITSTADAVSPPVIKTYKYGEGIYNRIVPDMYQYPTAAVRWGPNSLGTFDRRGDVTGFTIGTDPLIQLSSGSGPIVVYPDVIEYNGTEANNNGYVERLYDNTSIPYYIYDPTTMGNIYRDGFYLTDFGNYKPILVAEVYFGKDQTNTVKEIKRDDYTYTNFNTGTFPTGIKIQRNHPFNKLGDYAPLTDADCECLYLGGGCNLALLEIAGDFEWSNLLGVLDVPLQTEKKETIHPLNGSGSLVTTTDYTYNLVTLQPIEEDVVNSKGETFKKQSKYPIDYPSTEPYATMVNRNIINPVVEQMNFKGNNSTPFQSTRTNYNFWTGTAWSSSANNIIVPQTIETKTSPQTSYETRFRFTSYDDKANVTTVAKENDVLKTYLWGYNKAYPVAEITGTDYTTASSYINQTILDRPFDDASLRNHLNNLRGIAGTQVSTYTYRPLVGMTSTTDMNGRTTYYNYDEFGRLDHIKDKDGNIVKKFCYNYLGQPGNCSIFGNTIQSGSFTKNDCGQGYAGSTVTYTVPANTYYASNQTDANTKATNDLNANGQAYANANGTCTVTGVTVYGSNFIQYPYTVQFTNTSTNQVYYMALNEYGSAQSLIPEGTYNINIYPSSGSYINTSFLVNGFSSYGAGANFFSIYISAGSYVEIGD